MCGRYASFRQAQEIADAFDVAVVTDAAAQVGASWNVAPTDAVRVVLERAGRSPSAEVRRELHAVRWGLVPHWAKDLSVGARMINARSETITEKPSFRDAAARRRCIVPAEGYYEWQKTGSTKQPYFLHGEGPLAFAGLYELWPDPALADDHPAKWRWTSTILTTSATDALGQIHDRTPVVVPPDMAGDWLDPGTTDRGTVRSMVEAMPEPSLVPRPVGRAVGNVRNDGPQLIEPVGTA